MPERYKVYAGSDDDDFSETDISMRGGKGHTTFRQRSVSRHRHSPEAKNQYLTPVMSGARMQRSASTGGRRPREPEQPQVVIMNDVQQANSNKPSRRVQQRMVYAGHDSEEEYVSPPRRVRAERDVSPRQHRDYDLVMGQRLLERSDFRQDLEIWKQQQEIERLERELERHRDQHDPREYRQEEEMYEEEISDRLRRLERFERRHRGEEERRQLEQRLKIKKLEEAERKAAEEKDVKARLREERLKEIQRLQEEEEEREKLKKEIVEEEARKKAKEEEKRRKEIAMKAAAVEEWKIQQERMKIKEQEEAEKKDKEFRERLRVEFGYSEEEIEAILNKRKKEEKGKEKAPSELTWIKVHRKHLLPETLIAYSLPWEWDERDSNFIIIKQWITEDFQEQLFSHTRRLRENKMLTQTSSSTTELKVNDRNKDRMYLVRKKSPNRKSWIFT